MAARPVDADVLIAGAGPAGCAAAIVCAAGGLRTVLADRAAGPRARPGEALHPGVESLLRRLVPEGFDRVVGARHEGISVGWGRAPSFEPFGRDPDGPWRGFQVDRQGLDALLLERARGLGVDVRPSCRVLAPLLDGDAVVGAHTREAGPIRARTVIDATGSARWLGRALGVAPQVRSPRLLIQYGYAAGSCPTRDAAPAIVADGTGWTWTARVGATRYQWMRLDFVPVQRSRTWLPDEFARLTPQGTARAADVTWRLSPAAAGPGWFAVGDAAARLDPASSHGVLRALLSGWTAGCATAAALDGALDPREAAAMYQGWLHSGFEQDIARLAGMYAELGARGFG
ncbi:NAD(P)/FAD-dependent oxidoreductase [Streptomyces sp. NBC_00162]|uniref:NAD(P)/FAD-dependent oxidoreductase n=1 Tax=Streptomyces sp. NBC_00162 TaxID=2903629 RepID=UPI00214AF0EF|nr:FAD-dependent oxidoreductase [Streptomyces sp. NBC_00162]UUU38845.1 tryptophan 7-halogenase [Streptomyces sp. NBC_00162]